MRIAIVNAKDLGNDWRAEAHVAPVPEDFTNARKAGWNCGTRGTRRLTSPYKNHGDLSVRAAFWRAYEDGLKARRAYLK